MKIQRLRQLFRNRHTMAIGAGLLLAAAFPKPGLAGLAWIAPGLMLLASAGQTGKRAFGIGYSAGLAFSLATLYWLLLIPYSGAPILGWLSLGGYLALYQSVWVWLAWRWWRGPEKMAPTSTVRLGSPAATEPNLLNTGLHQSVTLSSSFFGPLANSTWTQRLCWSLACSVIWVALEMVRARLFSGFPWIALAVSQYQILPIIQIASLASVYGIAFLMVWFSVSCVCAVSVMLKHPTRRWLWLGDLILPLLVLTGTFVFGLNQLAHRPSSERFLKVALVQPSIPQTLIWDESENTNRFEKLIQLSRLALATKPDLLIWPESAVPNRVRWDPDFTYPAITNLVLTSKVWLILGSDDAEPHVPPRHTNDYDFFNSSFLISPDADLRASYQKQQLVIFGEYVPLAKWLPFLKWFTPVEGGFTPGRHPVPFAMTDLKAKTSVLICFEDVFPHLARHAVEPDTDFLVNLTNDGWFGESAAQWQHAANAVFRAVENGLPLIRCTNNGLTCWIDATGQMNEVYFGDSKDIYGRGFKTARVPLLTPGSPRQPTLYNRYGDWFGWGCVGISTIGLGLSGIRLHRKKLVTR